MTDENQPISGEPVEAAAPAVEQNHDEPIAQEEKSVPLSALEAERSQRQQLQDELKMMKEHLGLIEARQQVSQQPQEPSIQDDDVMTYGEFKKAASKFEKDIKMTLGELQMMKKHPDYEEIVTKYLPEVIKTRPKLSQYLQQTQDYEYAYEVAKASEGYRKDNLQKTQNQDAERLIANSQQAGSLSSVGGTTPISMAKRYKDMNDQDFRKEVAKNMGYV